MPKLKTVIKARYLRKENTNAEKILWQKIRNSGLGVKFRRQHPVDMFILDFYAPSLKLAIEVDGSPHTIKENKEYDKNRTAYLNFKGICVLRFWNSDIENNLTKVITEIQRRIKDL